VRKRGREEGDEKGGREKGIAGKLARSEGKS